jgi:hypothetical protein
MPHVVFNLGRGREGAGVRSPPKAKKIGRGGVWGSIPPKTKKIGGRVLGSKHNFVSRGLGFDLPQNPKKFSISGVRGGALCGAAAQHSTDRTAQQPVQRSAACAVAL